MILVVNDDLYLLNVGDSRAISSISQVPSQDEIHQKAIRNGNIDDNGLLKYEIEATSIVVQMSTDHKPSDASEFKRINDAGGYVY